MATVPDNRVIGSEAAPVSPTGSHPSHDLNDPEKSKIPVEDGPITFSGDEPIGGFGGTMASLGVARIEAMNSVITRWDRVGIFFGVFITAYAYGLDGVLRYAYQPAATNDFANHSLLSTVNVLRAVIAAAAQPTAGKIADVFGRLELIAVSIFFYIIGTIVMSTSNGVSSFSGGAIIYQIGYTMIILLLQVIIADLTSTRARLLFSYIPALPFLINTWVSGNVSAAVLGATTWRWGFGMWGIIFPVCTLPLLISFWIIGRRARNAGLLDRYKTPFQEFGFKRGMIELFWRLDVIGIIMLVACFALILVPLTLAGGFESTWHEAQTIAPIVVGIVCVPFFLWWQTRAPHPLVPFRRMKDRGIWGAMGIALCLNFAWYMQGDYLYSVMIVAFGMSVEMATRISSIYSFVSVVTGFTLGFIVYRVRRLKVFIVAGTCLFLVAFGLLIQFRGATETSSHVGVIAAQVLLGMAGGMFPYPAQASMQVSVIHEHLAVMTGIYLATYNVGSALGNAVSGAIWTQTLPNQLATRLEEFGNATLAELAYGKPFDVILEYPVGTPERAAIIDSYRYVQRLLCITGICLCVPLIAFALCTRNPHLNDEQTLASDSDEKNFNKKTEKTETPHVVA